MDLSKSIPQFLEVADESKLAAAPLRTAKGDDHFAQSVQIALNVANEEPPAVPRTDAGPAPVPVNVDDHQLQDREPKQNLTLSQVVEAMELIDAIAEDREPHTNETSAGNRQDAIVRALCIVAAYFAEQQQLRPKIAPMPIASSARGALALHDYLDALERSEIVLALEDAKHNKTLAAKILGITFRSLRYRLERLGIE
jgi:hypothetical protein